MKLKIGVVSFILLGLLAASCAWADEFGILSETFLYPDGLKLDTDSKLQWWHSAGGLPNVVTYDDFDDKREGRKSLGGNALIRYVWFGFGIIWDPDDDDVADPKDMSAYAEGSLKFWVKTQTPIKVGIKSQSGGDRWVRLDQRSHYVPVDNQWRFISIPLGTFTTNASEFSGITQLFMVASTANPTVTRASFHFDNVRWDTEETGALDHIVISPPTFTIPRCEVEGQPQWLSKSFIARGYDADRSAVDVYPAWLNLGIAGNFNAATGDIVIFTPSSSGLGSITATQDTISGSANIEVQDITWNDFFNIFIDEGLYGSLGTYDADGSGTANRISMPSEPVTDEHPPVCEESFEATYTITPEGYAGFFIQEGELTDAVSTKDVSIFRDGYLNFWVKTPVDLQISLRSGNLQGGDEASKVMLSDYNIAADNDWHEAYIALDDFKIWDNRLDFTQMKTFFNVAVLGEFVTSFSDTFWISNVRYVRRKETTPALSVIIKRRNDNQPEPTQEIAWSTAELGGGWEIADQYLEISYETSDPSWGAQIYTDNKGDYASPKYEGKPREFLRQQPVGLIGELNRFLNCPMAWMALDDTNTFIPIPVEGAFGTPGQHDYAVYFESDWGQEAPIGEWCWLKDLNSTKWDDTRGDIPGTLELDKGEIVSDFTLTGDEYSTFVSSTGIATGWYDPDDGTRVYILNPESPIVIYFAAKFRTARELQKYETNTLTMELYHY